MRLYQHLKKSPHRKFLGSTQASIAPLSSLSRNFKESAPNFPNGQFVNLNFGNDENGNKFTVEMSREETQKLVNDLLNIK